MAEITSKAYQDLRDYIQENWKYIELRDGDGNAVLRLDPSDSRVSWTHTAGASVLELTVVIKGSDADVNLPQAFGGSAIYKVASGGDAFSEETFSPFTMDSDADELTIKHQIQVPSVQ